MDIIKYINLSDLSLNDAFFNSLKDDYDGFEEWFGKRAQEGTKAFVNFVNNKIEGFMLLKDNEVESLEKLTLNIKRKGD